jgi:hypothetical protein
MKSNWFKNDWSNPLASWITAIVLMYPPTYVMYLVGRYDVLSHYWFAIVFGFVYSIALGWLVSVFAFRAVELMRKSK